MKKETEGYIVIAIGEKYELMANNFINTLRRHGDNRDVYVITDSSDEELYGQCVTDFERNGTLPKICLDKDLPFDHNLFLDVDMLCLADTQQVWDVLRATDQSILQMGVLNDKQICDGVMIGNSSKFDWNEDPFRVQGGFIYLRKEGLNLEFFEWMRNEAFPNYDKYASSKRYYKNSRTDQTLYSLAHCKFGIKPLEIFDYPFMTFLDSCHNDNAPTNKVTYRNRQKTFDRNVSFCHCMTKPGSMLYDKLYNQSMS